MPGKWVLNPFPFRAVDSQLSMHLKVIIQKKPAHLVSWEPWSLGSKMERKSCHWIPLAPMTLGCLGSEIHAITLKM